MADLTFDLPELDDVADDDVTVSIGGETYTARRPAEFAFERLYAMLSPSTTNADKINAMLRFLDAIFPDEDRTKIEYRLADPDDPLRSYRQLFEAAFGLCEYWGIDADSLDKPEEVVARPAGNRQQRRAVAKKTPAKKTTARK